MTVELSELEREKINACIMIQVLKDEREADRLDRKEQLTEIEAARLDELQERINYYRTLTKKIYII